MAVVAKKSTGLTNRDSSPRVINNPQAHNAMLRSFVGSVAVANGDSVGSTLRFGRIPSNALVFGLQVYCPDIGATTAMDLGLYRTTEDGGAAVDADVFASAVSLSGGALNGGDVAHESGVFSLANAEKRLWEVLGLSTDPKVEYDVTGTLTGAADAAGDIAVKCLYTI